MKKKNSFGFGFFVLLWLCLIGLAIAMLSLPQRGEPKATNGEVNPEVTAVCEMMVQRHREQKERRVEACNKALKKRRELFETAAGKLSQDERDLLTTVPDSDHWCGVVETTAKTKALTTFMCEQFIMKHGEEYGL